MRGNPGRRSCPDGLKSGENCHDFWDLLAAFTRIAPLSLRRRAGLDLSKIPVL
jgi:hypothetical protein